jgi:ubiquinone/menaquinone biosynthesis C-methylase UbiE
MEPTISSIFFCLILLAFALSLVRQVRKPTRLIGEVVLWVMNSSHSSLTDWGLQHTRVEKNFTILDVGCGGGRTIQKLAEVATEGRVYGVDYASGSVVASRRKNADLIKAGRVEIQKASVSALPFPAGSFDLVTAVETQYYWPDPVKDMQEILRVLKPGAALILIAESYAAGKHDMLQRPVMRLLSSKPLSADGHRKLFSAAGYRNVQIFEERGKGWICATGRKPL